MSDTNSVTTSNSSEEVFDELVKVNKEIYEKNAKLVTRNRTMSTLRDIYDVINKSLGIRETAQGLIEKIIRALDAQMGIILLYNQSSNQLVSQASCFDENFGPPTEEVLNFLRTYRIGLENAHNLFVMTWNSKEKIVGINFHDLLAPGLNKQQIQKINENIKMETFVLHPIKFGERTLGVIALGLEKEEQYLSKTEQEILNEIIDVIGIGIQNSYLFTQSKAQVKLLEDRNRDLDIVFRITNQIVTTLNPSEVVQKAADLIPQEMQYFSALISIYDEKQNVIIPTALTRTKFYNKIQSLIGNDLTKHRFYPNDPKFAHLTAVKAFHTKQISVSDNFQDATSPPLPKLVARNLQTLLNIKSIISLPIISRSKIIGMVTFFLRDKSLKNLTANDYDLMKIFSNQIGIALENAKLIEEYLKLNNSLKQKNIQLKNYAQKERDILDIMGHELRTPISIVRNSLSYIIQQRNEGTLEDTKLNEYLDRALRATKREITIIETMLSATKVETGSIELARARLNARELIDETMQGHKHTIEEKNLELKIEIEENSADIYADRVRIQEILDNLLSNAIKYTVEGYICVKVQNYNDRFLKFSIIDTGSGIPKEIIPELGRKFYRLSQHIDEQSRLYNVVRPGGTGLGLYVTFHLIKLQGGQIFVNSEVGKGSDFSFTIPKYIGQVERTLSENGSKDLLVELRNKKKNQNQPNPLA